MAAARAAARAAAAGKNFIPAYAHGLVLEVTNRMANGLAVPAPTPTLDGLPPNQREAIMRSYREMPGGGVHSAIADAVVANAVLERIQNDNITIEMLFIGNKIFNPAQVALHGQRLDQIELTLQQHGQRLDHIEHQLDVIQLLLQQRVAGQQGD